MKFEIEKRKFRTERLEFWKPEPGEYIILIDLSRPPRIREQKFKDSRTGQTIRKLFADFIIEVIENKQAKRYYWSIPIAGYEKDEKGELIIRFWEGSQRGERLKEIADNFGYRPHYLKVKVERIGDDKLSTRYYIEHYEKCLCLEKESQILHPKELAEKILEDLKARNLNYFATTVEVISKNYKTDKETSEKALKELEREGYAKRRDDGIWEIKLKNFH